MASLFATVCINFFQLFIRIEEHTQLGAALSCGDG
jgi:hypothetical protein